MVEMFLVKEIGEKPDCWALGCVLFAAAYSVHPFANAGNLAIINARYEVPEESTRSNSLVECLSRCFAVDPSRRASAIELHEHAHSALNGRPSRFSSTMESCREKDANQPRSIRVARTKITSKQKYQNKAKERRAQLMSGIEVLKAMTSANPKVSAKASSSAQDSPDAATTASSDRPISETDFTFITMPLHQGIRVAIAAETKRRGPHLVTNFKRYLTHLLTPVLEPMGLQLHVLASKTVNTAKTMEGGSDSKEKESLLRELDQSLRQGIRFVLEMQKPQPGVDHVESVSTSLTKLVSPLLADLTQTEQI